MNDVTESIEKIIVLTFSRDKRYATSETVLKKGTTIVTGLHGKEKFAFFNDHGPYNGALLKGKPFSKAKKYLVDEGFSLSYCSTVRGVTTAVFTYSLESQKVVVFYKTNTEGEDIIDSIEVNGKTVESDWDGDYVDMLIISEERERLILDWIGRIDIRDPYSVECRRVEEE